MRFSMATAAFMATMVAGNIVYTTEEVTITSCHPTVTNCPARSTVVSTTSYPVVATTAPTYSNGTGGGVPTYPAQTAPAPVSSSPAVATSAPVISVVTISTCIPTVIYQTVTVAPTAPVVQYTPAPSATGVISYPHNATHPTSGTPPPPQVTGAASNVQGSFAMAAMAGVAALIFA